MNFEKSTTFVYIENYIFLKSYINSSFYLNKYRTKIEESGNYLINGIVCNKMNNNIIVNFLPNSDSKLEKRKFNLGIKEELNLFKIYFKDVLNKNEVVPVFVKFSENINDNILVNLKLKNYLLNAVSYADNLIEEI
jgi:hypothetical protein